MNGVFGPRVIARRRAGRHWPGDELDRRRSTANETLLHARGLTLTLGQHGRPRAHRLKADPNRVTAVRRELPLGLAKRLLPPGAKPARSGRPGPPVVTGAADETPDRLNSWPGALRRPGSSACPVSAG